MNKVGSETLFNAVFNNPEQVFCCVCNSLNMHQNPDKNITFNVSEIHPDEVTIN